MFDVVSLCRQDLCIHILLKTELLKCTVYPFLLSPEGPGHSRSIIHTLGCERPQSDQQRPLSCQSRTLDEGVKVCQHGEH